MDQRLLEASFTPAHSNCTTAVLTTGGAPVSKQFTVGGIYRLRAEGGDSANLFVARVAATQVLAETITTPFVDATPPETAFLFLGSESPEVFIPEDGWLGMEENGGATKKVYATLMRRLASTGSVSLGG